MHILSDFSWFADELSNAIIQSQVLMRTYAAEHLMSAFKYPSREANSLAHSCVSQRDIQVGSRVYMHILCFN